MRLCRAGNHTHTEKITFLCICSSWAKDNIVLWRKIACTVYFCFDQLCVYFSGLNRTGCEQNIKLYTMCCVCMWMCMRWEMMKGDDIPFLICPFLRRLLNLPYLSIHRAQSITHTHARSSFSLCLKTQDCLVDVFISVSKILQQSLHVVHTLYTDKQ